MVISRLVRFGLLAAVLGFVACSPVPPETAPTSAGQPRMLEIPASVVGAAETVELDGTEMGTMWTFENPPLDYWDETYGFRPDEDWLEHVRLASVRYGRGCSASFVSSDGLVITNNHCARGCIDAVSTKEHDYLEDGFYAPTAADELTCPGLFLDQLIAIEDVTERVLETARSEMSDADIERAREARQEELDASCEAETGLSCQVVSLFHGGQYKLYKYRRFSHVKLVFTPETQAAFFGGDPDNFTYPRYDLDITFVRAYEDDGSTPASTPHYFAWDAEGAGEGELVFVTGNPGSTARQITVSQYLYEMEVRHPVRLDFFDARLEVMHAIRRDDPERGRRLQNTIFGYENAQKLYRGELQGLRDTLLMAKKLRWEKEFRTAVESDPLLAAKYGDVWSRVAEIQEAKARLYPSTLLNDPESFQASRHLRQASDLVAYVEQVARPEGEREDDYRSGRLSAVEETLRSPDSFALDQSTGMLAGRLALAQKWLAADAALAQAVRPGESPQEAAERLIRESGVTDAGFCDALMGMTPAELRESDDPLIHLALDVRSEREAAQAQWDALLASESVQTERLAAALFSVYGTDLPPDATFTLRITDGVVKRYPYNGSVAPAQTTLYGLYARAAEFDNEWPWELAPAFDAARGEVDMSVPINFVSTNDITGGNSGSPVIDREARWVGIAFDGNVESFPNEFLFASESGRTVSVHAAGITEALRSVYHTPELLEELLSGHR